MAIQLCILIQVLVAARGKALEADATYLSIAARTALDSNGVGAVAYKDR